MTLAVLSAALMSQSFEAQATDISEVSSKEFFAAKYYQTALEDERIKKIKKVSL